MSKMLKISVKTYTKNCIQNIINKKKMPWLCYVENIYNLIDKEIKGRFQTRNPTNEQIIEYKRHGSKLIDGEKFMYTCKYML